MHVFGRAQPHGDSLPAVTKLHSLSLLPSKSYEYEKLSSRDDYIRRLILEPGESDAPLVGRIEQIKLTGADDLYPFRAISYVWGQNNKD